MTIGGSARGATGAWTATRMLPALAAGPLGLEAFHTVLGDRPSRRP